MRCRFRADDYDGVYFIGDIHGDPLVFLQCMKFTGCVQCPRLRELIDLHRGFESSHYRTHGELLGDDLGMHAVHWKPGCRSLVVLAGDVIDNYRYGKRSPHPSIDRPFGHLAMDGEMPILRTLLRLQREARTHGGDVVWVFGNHDMANALNSGVHCKHYAALDQCSEGKNHKKFRADRVATVRYYMRQMGAVVACQVDHLFVCHGGVKPDLVDLLPARKLTLEGLVEMYHRGVLAPESKVDTELVNDLVRSGDGLTWYRPFEDGELWDARSLARIAGKNSVLLAAHSIQERSAMFKAHRTDYMQGGVHVVPPEEKDIHVVGMTRVRGLLKPRRAVALDLAMSRAFNRQGRKNGKNYYCSMSVLCYRPDHPEDMFVIGANHPRCVD